MFSANGEVIKYHRFRFVLVIELTLLILAVQGRKLLMESQLSVEELSRIWDLSDVNRNRMIDKEEWLVICHLIRALKQGRYASVSRAQWLSYWGLKGC